MLNHVLEHIQKKDAYLPSHECYLVWHTDRQTERQRDRQTDRQEIHTHRYAAHKDVRFHQVNLMNMLLQEITVRMIKTMV